VESECYACLLWSPTIAEREYKHLPSAGVETLLSKLALTDHEGGFYQREYDLFLQEPHSLT
jgi:hypothetical protein